MIPPRDAGRALKLEIAEKVMGLMVHEGQHEDYVSPPSDPVSGQVPCPNYPEDIAAAFQVVERMQAYCCDMTIEKSGRNWWVDFRSGYAQADTLPLAICLAALNALEQSDSVSTQGKA